MRRLTPGASGESDPAIELSALGQTDLRVDGEVAADVLSQPKRLGLLAYLCLARPRGPKQRQSLLPVFWPESSETNARLALNQSLSFLRRALGSDAILSHGRSAVEAPPSRVWCDVLAFEEAVEAGRVEDALRLYGGELFPGLHVTGSRQFERWLDGERDRLRALMLDATRQLVDELAGGGRPEEAVEWCARALEIDPLNGDFVRKMLDLLGRTGDERRLRVAYRAYAEALDSGLGILPPPAVEEAFRAAVTQVGDARRQSSSGPNGSRKQAAAAPAGPVAGPPAASAPSEAAGPGFLHDRRRRIGRRVALTATTVAVVVAAYLARADTGTADVSLDASRAFIAPLDVVGDASDRVRLARAAVDWAAREVARTGLVQVVAPGLAGLPDPVAHLEARSTGAREGALEAGAGLVVSGSLSERDGREVLEAAVVETATGRILSRVGPVPLDRTVPGAGLADFSGRVAGAVAVAADPTLGEWVATVREPPDFGAYRSFTDGLDALAVGHALDAVDHFLEAASHDTAFATAKIWVVRAFVYAHRHKQADSVARSILHIRPALTGWDRAMLDYYTGYLWGTWDDAYEAAREVVRIAPDPDWHHQLAGAALAAGRPREAREILEGLQEDARWIRDWPGKWTLLADAMHEAGEFEAELALAERWRDRTSGSSGSTTLRALAALGRLEELEERLDRMLDSGSPDNLDNAARRVVSVADEMRAHGHEDQATELYARLLPLTEGSPEPAQSERERARLLLDLLLATGDYEAAYEQAGRLSTATGEIHFRFSRGLAAAHIGREDEARRIADAVQDDDPLGMGHYTALSARILAALGDREGATARLALAFSQGFGRYPWLHAVPEFLPLRDYEPFQKITRPEGR